jgi:hypothetical protein
MTLNLQAQSGFRRDSMWCGPAAHAAMPSPAERNERGACTSFGRVLKAADITSVRPGSARCGIAQPCLTLSGQRSNTDERYGLGILGRRHIDLGRSPYSDRKIGNPCAEKVRPHRARQKNASEPALVAGVGGHWQGMLTITGSNVHLGTEMPVALSHFLKSQISNLQ